MPARVSLSQDVAELTACCASAHDQQKHVKEQLRRMQRRDQKARARSRASWQNMITFGVMVLAIGGAEFSWVPNLLSRFQQTGEPEEVQDEITKKYLELSAEELKRLLEPEGRTSVKHPLNQAHAFAAQFSVWNWVDAQNSSAGVAPSVAEVIKQRNLRFNETQSGIWGEFTTALSTEKSASYKWVARWKRDWNLAFGKASEHEVIPTETVRTKAFTECPIARTEGRLIALSNASPAQPQGHQTFVHKQPDTAPEHKNGFVSLKMSSHQSLQRLATLVVGVPKNKQPAENHGPETATIFWAQNGARLMS